MLTKKIDMLSKHFIKKFRDPIREKFVSNFVNQEVYKTTRQKSQVISLANFSVFLHSYAQRKKNLKIKYSQAWAFGRFWMLTKKIDILSKHFIKKFRDPIREKFVSNFVVQE